MIYFMYGSEDYLMNRQRDAFKEKAKSGEYKDFSNIFDALNFLNTLSFFTNMLFAYLTVEKFKELTEKTVLEGFESISKDPNKSLLICLRKSLTAAEAKKLPKLEGCMSIKEYTKYRGSALTKAVDAICDEQEANLTADAKKELIDRLDYAGNDTVTLTTLENYIGQLKYLAPVVEKVDVENNVPDLRQGKRFQLAAIVASGDADSMKKEARRLELERDFSAIALLSLLQREYRIAYLLSKGISTKEQGVYRSSLPPLDTDTAFKCLTVTAERVRDIKTGVYDELTAWHLALTELVCIFRREA